MTRLDMKTRITKITIISFLLLGSFVLTTTKFAIQPSVIISEDFDDVLESISANSIELLSPEDKTYYAPMSGYYAGPYGFEDCPLGEIPLSWEYTYPDGSGFIRVEAELDGHKNVIQMRKAGGGTRAALFKYFTSNVTKGIVEFWFYKDTAAALDATKFAITGEGGFIEFGVEDMDLYANRWVDRVTVGDNVVTTNTWHHVQIDFDISQGGYQVVFDGVLYGASYAYTFQGTPTHFYFFSTGTHWSGCHPNYGTWFDAFGFSFESGYEVGDNLKEGLLLSYNNQISLDWTGYSLDGGANVTIFGNTTIPIPELGTHTIQVFGNDSVGTYYQSELRSFYFSPLKLLSPEDKTYYASMSGYYPATYGFENELHATAGTDLEFIDEYHAPPIGAYVDIGVHDGPIYGHHKVLHIGDGQAGSYTYGVHYFDNPPTAGTIEFYLLVDNIHPPYTGTNYFHLRAMDDTIAVEMRINAIGQYLSNIEYFDGVSWQLISDQVSYKWYHHSISFDCESGVNGQFAWTVSNEIGTEVGRVENIEFQNDLNTLDELYLASDVPTYFGATRWDAFGFSWDPNYTVGDNLKEGLLLSYNTTIPLDWTGYSLDGRTNITILGNTTIPMPAKGTHTIQVFGNDSAGTDYRSELRSFQIEPLNPPSAPLNLVATAGENIIELSWSIPSSDGESEITHYNIYRGTSSGSYSLLGNTPSTGFKDTTVIGGTTYYYVVTAVNSAGESTFSNEAKATPSKPLSTTATTATTEASGPGISPSPGVLTILLFLGTLVVFVRRRKKS